MSGAEAKDVETLAIAPGVVIRWSFPGPDSNVMCSIGFHKDRFIRAMSGISYATCKTCERRIAWRVSIGSNTPPDIHWLKTGEFSIRKKVRRPEDPPSITR